MSQKNNFKGVVCLTSSQFRQLSSTGHIEVDGVGLDYSPLDTIYCTPDDETINKILKHSTFKTENGDDVWVATELDNSVYIKHENGTSSAGTRASKNYAELFAIDTAEGKTNQASVTTSGDSVLITARDSLGAESNLSIRSDGMTFSDKPKVKTSETDTSDVVVESDLTNYVQAQSETADGYYAQISNENGIVQITVSQNGQAPVHSLSISKDAVLVDGNVIGNSGTQSDQPAVLYTEQDLTAEQKNQVCVNLDIKDKLNHEQVYFGSTLPTTGIGTTYLENDVFILNNSNVTKNFYQLKTATGSSTLTWVDMVDFEKPSWKTYAPADTSQVLETEITITAFTQYSSLVGGKVLVKGYADNGAENWNITYFVDAIPVTFLGKITKTVIQGLFLTQAEGIATTALSIPSGEITFSCKYLW